MFKSMFLIDAVFADIAEQCRVMGEEGARWNIVVLCVYVYCRVIFGVRGECRGDC
jgi:hypothetical protein